MSSRTVLVVAVAVVVAVGLTRPGPDRSRPLAPQVPAAASSALVARLARERAQPFPDNGRFAYGGCNLLMISVHNVGNEHMSLYGYARPTTPRLDKWAEDALVFEDFYTPVSWSLPAATSLFTSLQPYAHKVMDRYRTNLLSPQVRTLPELLKLYSYKTAAFTGGLDYAKAFGHMRGFEEMPENPDFSDFSLTLTQAREWLARNGSSKFFLYLQGYTAHPPFTPPAPFKGVFSELRGRHVTVDNRLTVRAYRSSPGVYEGYYLKKDIARLKGDQSRPGLNSPGSRKVLLTQDDISYLQDLYDEEVLQVDSMLGDFLDSLDAKLLSNTVVVLYSEHGEMFGRHGRFGRAGTVRGCLYDDVVHVPLLVRLPGHRGGTVRGLTQIVDVMPTLLELLEIPVPHGIQGLSLLPLVRTGLPVNPYVFAGAEYNGGRKKPNGLFAPESVAESIRNPEWKLIHEQLFSDPEAHRRGQVDEETYELYDLRKDLQEQDDVSALNPAVVEELKGRLKRWAEASSRFTLAAPGTLEVPAAVVDKARQHGYW